MNVAAGLRRGPQYAVAELAVRPDPDRGVGPVEPDRAERAHNHVVGHRCRVRILAVDRRAQHGGEPLADWRLRGRRI